MKQFTLIIAILLFASSLWAQGVSSKQKPNIIFIAIDDLKPTIGAFGDDYAKTPVMDKLAEQSTIFTNNHTQQAVCGPSRASLMTGKRPDYTGVKDLKTRMRDVNPNILTIPQHFKQNGYTTAGVGKIYDPRCVDRETLDAESWSIPFVREWKLNYPKEFGRPALGYYQKATNKKRINELYKEAKEKGIKNTYGYVADRFKPPYEKSNVSDDAYMDAAIANRAIDLMGNLSKENEKPFFLAVGFKRPHLPFVAPQKYWDLYDSINVPTAAFQKRSKNSPDLAYHKSNEMSAYIAPGFEYQLDDNLLNLDESFQKELIRGYYACTSFVDAQIGKILDELKKKGLDKNTIVVVWGDHGWHLGDHSLWNKHSNFEQATRSPLIIYSPYSKKPITVNSPTEFVDIFPTLCELSGLYTPNILDGKSLVPLIENTSKNHKIYAVSQWPKGNNMGYSFRTENYRYTIWLKNKLSMDNINANDIVAQELYDYKNDPLEKENHIGKKEYRSIQAVLTKLAREYFASEKEKFNKKKKTGLTVGATLTHPQLNTIKEKLFLKDFKYLTPANAAKQQVIHPSPKVWNWRMVDDFIDFSKKHNLEVRLHGPISPQVSRWAKEDIRTVEELDKNMTEFATAFAIRFNNEPTVKWMDVVNETIKEKAGEWVTDMPGVNKWENPWFKMGVDENGYPLFILKAFEIATKHAPNIKLIYNLQGGMQEPMWNKLKETVLYIRSKGHRVDGIGWQAHIMFNKNSNGFVVNPEEEAKKFADLIDWAHQNDLEFHVTELDFHIKDKDKLEVGYKEQAAAYQKIVDVLIEKSKNGVVTLNLWDMGERFKKGKGYFHSIYDTNFKPTPSYKVIKEALKHQSK